MSAPADTPGRTVCPRRRSHRLTTHIRPISAHEAPLFASVGNSQRVEETYRRMVEQGETRPEWCFVAFEDARPVGRMGFWALPAEPDHRNVWGARAPADPGLAEELVRTSHASLAECGVRTVEWRIRDDDPFREPKLDLLSRIHYPFIQAKSRHVLDPARPRAASPSRLEFRSRRETGDEIFVDAIRRVTVGTLDRMTRRWVDRLGPEAEARKTFEGLSDLHDESGWWQLAFEGEDLVGLIVPQRLDQHGVINYIGVVPGHRGRRRSAELIDRAVATLAAAGLAQVIADVDVENAPMAAAFERAGFVRRPGERVYEADLPL